VENAKSDVKTPKKVTLKGQKLPAIFGLTSNLRSGIFGSGESEIQTAIG
jgi:hypothetical protein